MSEYIMQVDPASAEHGDYVLMVTPYTQEDEVFYEAIVHAEGEAAIDDAFKQAFEARALERFGGRKAFEEHVLTRYWQRDTEWEWVQDDQLIITGPKEVIVEISELMDAEAYTHYLFDPAGFVEYVQSMNSEGAESDVEVSLDPDEEVLVVTPYSAELARRMQLAGMDGSADDPGVRAAFTAEALGVDPDFNQFHNVVSACIARHRLTVHFGGNDFIVLGGDPDALEKVENELDDLYSTQRHTGGELQDLFEAHEKFTANNGPQGGGAGGLH